VTAGSVESLNANNPELQKPGRRLSFTRLLDEKWFNLTRMDRILILGSGGAGKSTFAKHGELLNIKVDHLDRHYWKPGWVKPSSNHWLWLRSQNEVKHFLKSVAQN